MERLTEFRVPDYDTSRDAEENCKPTQINNVTSRPDLAGLALQAVLGDPEALKHFGPEGAQQ